MADPIKQVDLSTLIPRLKRCYQAGFTDRQILETLKITVEQFYKMKKLDGVRDLIEKWKLSRVESLENRLYEKAMGYRETYTKEQVVNMGERGFEVVPLVNERIVDPCFNSIKFYLTNRAPDRWKDRSELMVDSTKELTTDELEEKVTAYLKQRHEKKIEGLKRKSNLYNRGEE